MAKETPKINYLEENPGESSSSLDEDRKAVPRKPRLSIPMQDEEQDPHNIRRRRRSMPRRRRRVSRRRSRSRRRR